MIEREMIAKVKNVSKGKDRFVVARTLQGELWYYGRYSTEEIAKAIAKEVDGTVLEDEIAREEPKEKKHCPHCGRELTEFDVFMNFCPLCMKSLKERQ